MPQQFPPHHHLGVLAAAPQACKEWKPLLVHAMVARGLRRFDEFARHLSSKDKIARNILSSRLGEMHLDGLVDKVPQSESSSRVFYVPTEKAIALGDTILAASIVPAGAPVTVLPEHPVCGASLVPQVGCVTCADGGRPPASSVLSSWDHLREVPTDDVHLCFRNVEWAILSDPWSLRIMSCLYHTTEDGTSVDTFDRLIAELGIARNILAARLKELVDDGVVVKELYQTRPDRFRYRPADIGPGLRAFLAVLGEWGAQWCLPPDASPGRPQHEQCGAEFRPVMFCGACPDS